MKFYSEAAMERARKIQEVIFASDGEADQLVAGPPELKRRRAGSRDHRDQRAADAAVARAVRAARLRRAVRQATRATESLVGAGGGCGLAP